MNIYYNKIRFIKIWKWWKQLYNAFVKLYSIIMERDFGVRIHKGQNHFFFFFNCTSADVKFNIFFWSLTFSQFQSFVIVHLLLMYTDSKTSCRDDMAHASSWHILARAHHIFYLEKFGLQKAGRYDYTHHCKAWELRQLTGIASHGEGQLTKSYYCCCYERVFWTGRQRKTATKLFRHYINLNNELRSAHYY